MLLLLIVLISVIPICFTCFAPARCTVYIFSVKMVFPPFWNTRRAFWQIVNHLPPTIFYLTVKYPNFGRIIFVKRSCMK